MNIKRIVEKIIFGPKASSETYIKYLKNKGVRIGDGTVIFSPRTTVIDHTRPWLVEIGKNVQITKGVTLLTHGYDWSVIKGKYGDILGSSGKVKIGNNVFIGMNTTILKGVNIGDNVIIGANSLINKDVPNDVVVAGNPFRVVCTIEEYYKKREKLQFKEAKELVREYYKVYNKYPEKKYLSEFFWLFEKRNTEKFSDESFERQMKLLNNYEFSKNKFNETKSKFKNYEEFIEKCFEDDIEEKKKR